MAVGNCLDGGYGLKHLVQLVNNDPSTPSALQMQQLLNDVLIALCARRIGADLYTFNRRDFDLIRRHRLFSLKVLVQSAEKM